MSRSSMFPRPATRTTPPGAAIDAAGMVEAATDLAASLPGLVHQAEAGGLQLVAQHLNKALQLARRVAATAPPPR